MRSKAKTNFNLIFDPISKSALIHTGDRVIWLAGPFATYRDAMSAAARSMTSSATKR
ncbi:hypothetical protein IHQ71_14550 [Rhizobium sp. TH2]|uniref:hypothetical protein n=1 Tax=Rhizobium sp. TH2 TaxID=2775403 RepID=UPI002157A7B0|nr:hypothetical protein [Rhizobium sp. TH2]UVC11700.1 hypothetical protein IHQ71_14550 [Rhizobium sp. TH2]